jgi:hypothetical protein
MIDDMGIFRTTVGIASLADPTLHVNFVTSWSTQGASTTGCRPMCSSTRAIAPVRVDRFEIADGRVLEREVGFAMLSAGGRSTPTIVVFARTGDLTLLGAFGLEGLNLRVDLGRKELVPAGPVPAAAA